MKRATLFASALIIVNLTSAQDSRPAQISPTPKVQDLDFLIGSWEITFEIYDTHDPSKGVLFSEKGRQQCYYDLPQNGEHRFITCKGEVTNSNGRNRTFQESFRYSRFTKSFERVGIFSNWPSTAQELVTYDSIARKLILKGELPVQNNMLERYEDVYTFNEGYTQYTRRNVANFSDMPITLFNLTLTGTGNKIK